MEFNDYFGTIREFFKAKKFCDLKIVAVPNDLESSEASSNAPSVLCHSLVLISAIPEIKFCIPTNQENEEEHRTIFLHNSTNAPSNVHSTSIWLISVQSNRAQLGTVLNFLVTFALSSLIFASTEQQITTEAKQQITDKVPALKLLFCHFRSTLADLILAFWLFLTLTQNWNS